LQQVSLALQAVKSLVDALLAGQTSAEGLPGIVFTLVWAAASSARILMRRPHVHPR